MRPLRFSIAVFLSVATHASAQVTVDLHALQALPAREGGSANLPRTTSPPAQHLGERPQIVLPPLTKPAPNAGSPSAAGTTAAPSVAPPSAASPSVASAPATASAPVTAPPAVAPPPLPQSVPQTASINPIAPAPPITGSAPPPPVVSDKAATSAGPTSSGLRLMFAAGQSDLSPDSAASIKQLATVSPASDATSFNILAYAPGNPDDPSTARRISLSRAMAVRSALVADGVSSARIYVRAMGAQSGTGPADRVDVNVVGATASGDTATQVAPK